MKQLYEYSGIKLDMIIESNYTTLNHIFRGVVISIDSRNATVRLKVCYYKGCGWDHTHYVITENAFKGNNKHFYLGNKEDFPEYYL